MKVRGLEMNLRLKKSKTSQKKDSTDSNMQRMSLTISS